jgi:large subunit ribosomal protein L22
MVKGISMQAYDGKTMAKVIGKNLPVSKKVAYEVTNHIRGRTIEKAIAILKDVQAMKTPVPYKRYNKDTPHRKGDFASGRFPEKAARYIIPLLKSLKSNADDKGLTGDLILVHSAANMTAKRHRAGRIRGVKRTTHVEFVAAPITKKEETKQKPKVEKKETKLVEEKPLKKVEEKPKVEKKETKLVEEKSKESISEEKTTENKK